MDDVIRRQDAIACIENCYWLKGEDKERLKKGIESLPSAQRLDSSLGEIARRRGRGKWDGDYYLEDC